MNSHAPNCCCCCCMHSVVGLVPGGHDGCLRAEGSVRSSSRRGGLLGPADFGMTWIGHLSKLWAQSEPASSAGDPPPNDIYYRKGSVEFQAASRAVRGPSMLLSTAATTSSSWDLNCRPPSEAGHYSGGGAPAARPTVRPQSTTLRCPGQAFCEQQPRPNIRQHSRRCIRTQVQVDAPAIRQAVGLQR